jgi:pyruvate/2-oxoglutarate dehydrogenase complex dihydrolipoamide dehydrogenase (E3) component
MAEFLGKDDPELRAVIRRRFTAEGIVIHERTSVNALESDSDGIVVTLGESGERIAGSHLLIAAGRKPNLDGLNLDAAGVAHDATGISVDRRLRTANKRIFAIGDVTGRYQFTHMAGYDAGIVLRNILFRLPAKTDNRAVPWVTYTDPELANVGQTEAQAIAAGNTAITILRWPFHDNDRAQAERDTQGLIKVVLDKKGRVLGAGIAGPRAGELILPWIVAVGARQKIGTLASVIAPYPTLSEITKRAAGSYYTPKLFSERTRKIVRFLLRF